MNINRHGHCCLDGVGRTRAFVNCYWCQWCHHGNNGDGVGSASGGVVLPKVTNNDSCWWSNNSCNKGLWSSGCLGAQQPPATHLAPLMFKIMG